MINLQPHFNEIIIKIVETKNHNLVPFLSSLQFRVCLIVSTVVVLSGFFISSFVVKAHSESDINYRQESIFLGSGLNATKSTIAEPLGDDGMTAIAMSFEMDKITPTPTPVINPGTDEIWYKIADCESHRNWKSDTGNGYYGGLQFSMGAWASVGGTGKPSEASAEEQIAKGRLLQARRGWGPWGGCSKKLGLL